MYVRLTQFKVKEFKRILRDNGYKEVRCCGSHQTWSNGASKITLPTVKLSPVIAARLIKEYVLRVDMMIRLQPMKAFLVRTLNSLKS